MEANTLLSISTPEEYTQWCILYGTPTNASISAFRQLLGGAFTSNTIDEWVADNKEWLCDFVNFTIVELQPQSRRPYRIELRIAGYFWYIHHTDEQYAELSAFLESKKSK